MRIDLNQQEVKEFFDSIDIDKSGMVQFAELQIDYERYCKKTLNELEQEEKIMTSNNEEKVRVANERREKLARTRVEKNEKVIL